MIARFSGIWIHFPIPSLSKVNRTPSDKTHWIRACVRLPVFVVFSFYYDNVVLSNPKLCTAGLQAASLASLIYCIKKKQAIPWHLKDLGQS